jgi:hypothetical protein
VPISAESALNKRPKLPGAQRAEERPDSRAALARCSTDGSLSFTVPVPSTYPDCGTTVRTFVKPGMTVGLYNPAVRSL